MASNQVTVRKEFNFTWVLENFPYFWHKKGEKIVSPVFIVNTMENSKWRLWLHPRGQEKENYISCFLVREGDSKGPTSMEIDFNMSLLDSHGSTVFVTEDTTQTFSKGEGFGLSDFYKRDNAIVAKGTLRNNLTVCCRMWKAIGKISSDGMCFARTRMGVERRSFVWKIVRFSTLQCNDKRNIFRIKSASNDELIMTLNLFIGEICDEFGTICIDCATSDPMISLFTLKIVILDNAGGTLEFGQDELWFDSISCTKQLKLSKSKQQLVDKASLYLPKDVLTLQFECTFSNKVVSEEIEEISYDHQIRKVTSEDQKKLIVKKTVSDNVSALKTDLSTLFTERAFCDVNITTNMESFPAHWVLLSARSSVFRAMYSSDMKEKAKHCIDIPDLVADTVRRMLLYIYTDSLEDVNWENASQLYVAADKYDILSLKNKCSAFLKDNLCGNNACDLLVLADRHSDDDFKKYVQDFIIKYDKDNHIPKMETSDGNSC